MGVWRQIILKNHVDTAVSDRSAALVGSLYVLVCKLMISA